VKGHYPITGLHHIGAIDPIWLVGQTAQANHLSPTPHLEITMELIWISAGIFLVLCGIIFLAYIIMSNDPMDELGHHNKKAKLSHAKKTAHR